MNEGNGSQIFDQNGLNVGDIQGGAIWTTGHTGTALGFDGADNYVEMNQSHLNTTDQFTVSAWVMANGLNRGVITSQDGSMVSSFFLYQNIYDWAFSFYATDDSSSTVSTAYTPLTPAVWQHITGVHNPITNTISLYVNGVLEDSQSLARPAWGAMGNTQIGRAKLNGSPYDFFSGVLDDVCLFDRVLSSHDIWLLYQE